MPHRCLAAVLVAVLILILVLIAVLILVLIAVLVLVLILVVHVHFLRYLYSRVRRYPSIPIISGFILGFEKNTGK